MPARPHIVYVAWGFPPSRASGVYRALATANAMARRNWQVTVLTVPPESYLDATGIDASMVAQIDPTITVVPIPFSWPAREGDVRRWSLAHVLWPQAWQKMRNWRDQRHFPEAVYGAWQPALVAAAQQVHAQHPVDLTIVTMNPQVSLTAALALAQQGIPYVVDYRDAWSLHTYSGVRRHGPGSRVHQWETRGFVGAYRSWFVNEPLRAWHAEHYPAVAERMRVVRNGYDHDFTFTPAARTPDEPLRYGYIGTLTSVVPIEPTVAGWNYWQTTTSATSTTPATLTFYGYLGFYAAAGQAMLAQIDAGAEHGVRYGGPTPRDAIASTYGDLDVLVLALGGGSYITSGKVYEYMATGLPIVSVLTPDNAAAEVLAGYPRWHPAADLSPAAVASAYAKAAADARRSTAAGDASWMQARAFAAPFRRDHQLDLALAELTEVIS